MNPDIALAERIATLLDNQFRIGKWGFGIDAIIDLLPVGGDTIVLLLSLSLVLIGVKMRIPGSAIATMLANIAFAFVIGLIPLLGDAAYFLYRPNVRNLAILRRHSTVA